MKDLYDFIKGFDLHTIIVVGIAFWWMNGNIKELDIKLSDRITSLDHRVNDLSERVARIEGILTHRDLCAAIDQKNE